MPNWVVNRVKFKNNGREIINSIIGKQNECEEYVDFNKIVPMPKSLHLTCGGNQDYAVQYAIMKMKNMSKFQETIDKLKATKSPNYFIENYLHKFYKYNNVDDTSMEQLEEKAKEFEEMLKNGKKDYFDEVNYEELGIHNFEDLGNAYINNVINYGCDTWYDWSIKNWGTKWNASNTYVLSDDEIEFNTAWSCPMEVLQALSKKFSDTEMEVSYADEDIGSNCGRFILLNGEMDEFVEEDTDFALDLWGYDKDEWYAEMDEYENEEE